jgi:MarR family transcriptional regulator, temperature-dependent positive regulator of motility
MVEHSTDHGAEKAELALMRLIGGRAELSQRELASSLGMSLGKANYVLRALIAKGFVKAENYRKSTNKMAYLYLLTPSGVAAKAELTRRFLARKLGEYEALRVEIEQLKEESSAGANRG